MSVSVVEMKHRYEYSMFATFSRYFECRHCEVQIIAQKMFPFSLLVRGKNYICV